MVAICFALVLPIAGCEKPKDNVADKPHGPSPAKVSRPVSETQLNVVELTPEAVARLGLKTEIVGERSMPRRRAYGADVVLPTGASVIVSAPLAGTVQQAAKNGFPQAGQGVKEGMPVLSLMPILSPERAVLTPAERIRFAEAKNAVAQSRIDAEGTLQQATVQVEAAQIALDRAERLLKEKAGTIRTVDEARAQLELAKKGWNAASARKKQVDGIKLDEEAGTLQPIPVTTPLTGIIRSTQVQPGQMIAAGGVLFEVMDDRTLWVKVPVYVGDLEEVDASRPCRLTLLSGRLTNHDVEVKPLAAPPTALPLSATVDLYYELPNPDRVYRPGQKVAAYIGLKGSAESLAVPWSAVIHDIYGGQWVYQEMAERKYVRRRVEIEGVSDGWGAVSRGLKAGVKIVTAGAAELSGTEFGFAK
ncbi:MAG: efflux RND transporter periplasmic adaptor subunit [Planctomycetales bacterium]